MLSEPLVKLNSVYVKVQEALLHLRGDLLVGDTGVVGKAIGGAARIFDAPAFYAQQVRQILSKYGNDAHLYMPGVGYLNGFAAGNYLESTGNTNAALDGAVGLVLDAAGSVGPALSPVASATITDLGSGRYRVEANTTGRLYFGAANLENGATYRVSFNIESFTGSSTFNSDWCDTPQSYPSTAPFVGEVTYVASRATYDGTYNFLDITTGLGTTLTINTVRIRKVSGIHATQATTANKPTLRRGIVNLLEYSTKIDDGAWWPSTNLSLSSTTVDGLPAVKMTPTTTNGVHRLSRGKPIQNGAKYTAAVVVKAAGYNYFGLKSGVVGADAPVFNLATGALSQGTGTIADLGGGRYLCCHTFTGNADQLWISYWTTLATGDFSAESFAGDGVSGTHIFAGGLFQGTLTAQQIIAAGGIPLTTTAPASSQYGAYAWEFDGSDDSLPLSGPLFQMTDDHCVIAAYTPTAIQRTYFSPSYTSNTHRIATLSYTTPGQHFVEWYDGTSYVAHQLSGSLNVPVVISAKKASGTLSSRCNGTQFGSSAAFATAVNGASAGIGAPILGAWRGKGYPIIAIKGTVSDAELRVLEKWLGSIAGVPIA